MAVIKIAHYFYGDGHELVVSACVNKDGDVVGVRVRKPDGTFPICPVGGKPSPHPSEVDGSIFDPAYTELGLYYNYPMPGWWNMEETVWKIEKD